MWGWSSRAADSASARKRARSAAEASRPRRSDLQRDDAAEAVLPGPIDDAHPAAAQLLEQLAIADPPGWAGRRAPPRGDGQIMSPVAEIAAPTAGRSSSASAPRPTEARARRRGPGAARDLVDVGRPRRCGGRRSVSVLEQRASDARDRRGPRGVASGDVIGASPERRRLAQHGPQASQGPEVAHPGRRLAQAQGAGGLAVGELLEVAHQEDLAVVLVECTERLVEPRTPARAAGPRRPASARRVAEVAAARSKRRAVRERRGRPAAARGRRSAASASRCRRWASMIWSRAICRSHRWNGIAGSRR